MLKKIMQIFVKVKLPNPKNKNIWVANMIHNDTN